MKYDGLEARNIVESLIVNPISNTQILQIKYQSKDPNEAKDVLKSVTDEFIVTAKELVPNGNVRVIEEVELPQNPVSPNKKNEYSNSIFSRTYGKCRFSFLIRIFR